MSVAITKAYKFAHATSKCSVCTNQSHLHDGTPLGRAMLIQDMEGNGPEEKDLPVQKETGKAVRGNRSLLVRTNAFVLPGHVPVVSATLTEPKAGDHSSLDRKS